MPLIFRSVEKKVNGENPAFQSWGKGQKFCKTLEAETEEGISADHGAED